MTAVYKTPIKGRIVKTAITAADGYHLSYILAEEEITDELGCGRRSYSFFAALCGDDGEADAAYVGDATSEGELACKFFSLISDGAVMPCTLESVIEDLVASH